MKKKSVKAVQEVQEEALDMAIQKMRQDSFKEAVPVASFTPEGIFQALISITANQLCIDEANLYAIAETDDDGDDAGISIYELPRDAEEFELGAGEIYFGDKMKLTFEDAVITAEDNKPKKCSYPNWWSRVKVSSAEYTATREARKLKRYV